MFKTLPITDPDNEYRLEYYNPIGLLFQNHIFLHEDDKLLEFEIEEIKSIFFKRERDLKQNYFLFVIACLLLSPTFFLNENLELLRYVGCGFSAAILLFSFAKKTYQYKIVLFTKHNHLFSIPVNEEYKDDACELLSMAKTKIKKSKSFLKAS